MATMVTRPAQTWSALPDVLDYLPASLDPIRRQIIARAQGDVGLLEDPDRPNRATLVDAYLRRCGTPESMIEAGTGYWCAAWVGAVFIDCGACVPRDYGACGAWVPFLKPGGPTAAPELGDAILYGSEGHPSHIGIVGALRPRCVYEGNANTNNNTTGIGVFFKPIDRGDILGYIAPARPV